MGLFGDGSSAQKWGRTLGILSGAVGSLEATGSGLLFESLWPDDDSGGYDMGKVLDYQSYQLLRSQYEDWKNTFQPIELNAINQTSLMNKGVLPNALNEAKETTQNVYGSMGGVIDRQNRSLGIEPTKQQSETSKRLLNLSEAASVANAQNKTRAATRTMDEMLIMGTTPNPRMGG